MKPCSKEFRGEVLTACDRGRGTRAVATHFNVSESWVRRVKQERRELNKIAPCLTRRRTPKGERLLASVPHGHWKTTTFLAALQATGLTAPLVVDGAINGELFLGWVRFHLVGARLLYLPPYSPDLNPIELVFSKFKWLLQSASARTVESLWSLCGEPLDRFTEAECRNCFKHCGYRYT